MDISAACGLVTSDKRARLGLTYLSAIAICVVVCTAIPATERKPAVFEVLLPVDAGLELNGNQTRTRGEVRRFESPPLDAGGTYAYTLKVSWHDRIVHRTITLSAGRAIVVDMRKEFEGTGSPKSLTLRIPPAIALEAGSQALLAIHVRADVPPDAVTFSFSGLPRHVQVVPAASGTGGQGTWRGIVVATPEAQPGTSVVRAYARSGQIRAEANFEVVVTRATGGGPASRTNSAEKKFTATPERSLALEKLPARFIVHVPADAILEVDGARVKSTGEIRRFESPPLDVGARYRCDLSVTARDWTASRQVVIQPGQEVVVDFAAAPAETELAPELNPARYSAPAAGTPTESPRSRPDESSFSQPAAPSRSAISDRTGAPSHSGSSTVRPYFRDRLPPLERKPARFIVHLPADANLEVDGTRVRSTGAVRSIESPPLEAGAVYSCDFKATWHGWTATRQVIVRPGQEMTVDFTSSDQETEPTPDVRPVQFTPLPAALPTQGPGLIPTADRAFANPPTQVPILPVEVQETQAGGPGTNATTVKVSQEQEVFPVLPAEKPLEPASSSAATSTPDRWFLMKSLQGTSIGAALDGTRTSISGWTEGSFTASTVKDNQLPMGFNYLANQFLLQQNWLRIDRSVVTSGTTEPTFGFRSDWILPGSDYRFTISRGLFSGQLTADDGSPNTYGIDPVQFYGEAYFPTIARGLDVKFGRMFCQYGAESIDAPPNALASHSYTFIYDPFTHTGIMGTLQVTTAWSIQLGIIMGPDVFIDPAASPYGMFSVKWAPPGGRDSVLVSGLLGSGRFDENQQFNNPNILDLVYIHTFSARLSYTLDALCGYQTNVPDIGTATWFSAANYLTYKFTPRLSGNTRLEFFDDVDGNRTGFKGLYTAVTAGLNFQPRKDIVFRPEVRYDYNNESRPFQDNHGVFTAATDLIVRW